MNIPICVNCSSIMRIEKNGVLFVEKDGYNNPYAIWSADKYKCPYCFHETLSGYGKNPVIRHFEENFFNYLDEIISNHDLQVIIEKGILYVRRN